MNFKPVYVNRRTWKFPGLLFPSPALRKTSHRRQCLLFLFCFSRHVKREGEIKELRNFSPSRLCAVDEKNFRAFLFGFEGLQDGKTAKHTNFRCTKSEIYFWKIAWNFLLSIICSPSDVFVVGNFLHDCRSNDLNLFWRFWLTAGPRCYVGCRYAIDNELFFQHTKIFIYVSSTQLVGYCECHAISIFNSKENEKTSISLKACACFSLGKAKMKNFVSKTFWSLDYERFTQKYQPLITLRLSSFHETKAPFSSFFPFLFSNRMKFA